MRLHKDSYRCLRVLHDGQVELHYNRALRHFSWQVSIATCLQLEDSQITVRKIHGKSEARRAQGFLEVERVVRGLESGEWVQIDHHLQKEG